MKDESIMSGLKFIDHKLRWTFFKVHYTMLDVFYPHLKRKKGQVNLLWWEGHCNLGDYLSSVIYEWVLEQKNLCKSRTIKETKVLMALGSILAIGAWDATVWGSGVLSMKIVPELYERSFFRKLDIRAVRGPITRHILRSIGYDCPEVYGDPAILMPFIYPPKREEKRYGTSLVSHYAKAEEHDYTNVNLINIETHDYKHFIDELLRSEKVISSSLHGVILAEVYGIPAVYLNKDTGDDLKFWDWYMSTGRNDVRYARTVEEAMEAEPMPPIDPGRLANMQKQLLDSFPVDLWDQ